VLFYVHPRELDPDAPRLKMNPLRQFKSFVNLRGTERKVMAILRDFQVVPFRDLLESQSVSAEAYAG
jgi:hypothetical protein